jgi:hypothetical protein
MPPRKSKMVPVTLEPSSWTQWADKIETWPWSKTVILVGIVTFIICWFVLFTAGFVFVMWPQVAPEPAYQPLVDSWLRGFEQVLDASLWAMGIGGGVLGFKRATTKADVIDAEARAGVTMTASGRETGSFTAIPDVPTPQTTGRNPHREGEDLSGD